MECSVNPRRDQYTTDVRRDSIMSPGFRAFPQRAPCNATLRRMHDHPEPGGDGNSPAHADGRGAAPGPLHARLGDGPFATLAERLYFRIDRDIRIRSLFPEDLGPTSESVRDMREFLVQFFGGAPEYSRRKGHPRLRARHMRFPIDQAARDAWLENALGALRDSASAHALDRGAIAEIEAYLVRTSQFMINREEAGGARD